MIEQKQLEDVMNLRKNVLDLISKGVPDEYLLATYNGVVRHLDKRLPAIRQRVEGNTLKQETRSVVSQQRQAMGRKSGTVQSKPQGSAQKSA